MPIQKKSGNISYAPRTFPKDYSPKVNVIVRLGFELTYYAIAIQHISLYVTGKPLYEGQIN